MYDIVDLRQFRDRMQRSDNEKCSQSECFTSQTFKNSKGKRFGTADHPCELFGCSSKSYLRFAVLYYLVHIFEISAYSGTVLNRSVVK